MENKFISFPQAAQKFSIGLRTPQCERFNVGLNELNPSYYFIYPQVKRGLNGIKISPTKQPLV
jgi:hypothetical protein